jgi:hypothetical protein
MTGFILISIVIGITIAMLAYETLVFNDYILNVEPTLKNKLLDFKGNPTSETETQFTEYYWKVRESNKFKNHLKIEMKLDTVYREFQDELFRIDARGSKIG